MFMIKHNFVPCARVELSDPAGQLACLWVSGRHVRPVAQNLMRTSWFFRIGYQVMKY